MNKRDWGINDPNETYWYNMRTNEVEDGPQSLALYRVEPFETREEAEHALRTLAERSKAWRDEEDDED